MPNEIQSSDVFEIIRTTRSMRRLKPDPLIRKILEAGVCAPSGGNMQRWRFLVVRDPRVKETVGALWGTTGQTRRFAAEIASGRTSTEQGRCG
jgi:nitroreductase